MALFERRAAARALPPKAGSGSGPQERAMLVKTILRAKGTEVVTAQADATVAQIARLLRDKRIGCVVIAEAGGRIAGIVSERDIVQGLANEGPAFLDRRASQAMVREVVSCTAETSVEELMMLMT